MDFNSILIGSENPDGLVEYYTKVLGAPTFSDGGYSGWQIGSGWVDGRAALRGQGHERRAGPDHLEHRDRRRQGRLRADEGRRGDRRRGALRLRSGDDAAISTTAIATLADPDGNYFQLMSPIQM